MEANALSHSQKDKQNLSPLPLQSTDLFESYHAPFIQIRTAKKTSKVRFFYELHWLHLSQIVSADLGLDTNQ